MFSRQIAHRLELLIEPHNHAGRALALSAGFAEEGQLRGRVTIHGEPHDVVVYGLLAP